MEQVKISSKIIISIVLMIVGFIFCANFNNVEAATVYHVKGTSISNYTLIAGTSTVSENSWSSYTFKSLAKTTSTDGKSITPTKAIMFVQSNSNSNLSESRTFSMSANVATSWNSFGLSLSGRTVKIYIFYDEASTTNPTQPEQPNNPDVAITIYIHYMETTANSSHRYYDSACVKSYTDTSKQIKAYETKKVRYGDTAKISIPRTITAQATDGKYYTYTYRNCHTGKNTAEDHKGVDLAGGGSSYIREITPTAYESIHLIVEYSKPSTTSVPEPEPDPTPTPTPDPTPNPNPGGTSGDYVPAPQTPETTPREDEVYLFVSDDVNSVVVHTPVYIEEKGITEIKETQVIYDEEKGQEPLKDITTEITVSRYIVDENAQEIVLGATIRDFKADGRLFEDGSYNDGLTLGLVGKKLSNDRTPTYNLSVWRGLQRDNGITENDLYSFYHTVPGKNIAIPIEFVLKNNGLGEYVYSSSAFFPIDGQGFGNQNNHNFHFTTQISSTFQYTGKEYFEFSGDDDVWVFIGDTLALDIGGTHGELKNRVEVAEHIRKNGLDISIGDIVTFDLFHMERHTDESNLKILTNMNFITKLESLTKETKPVYELELDGEYEIDLETIGIHRDTQGYSEDGEKKDYGKWGKYEVSFPYDVYKIIEDKQGNKTYQIYKARTWVPVDEEEKEQEGGTITIVVDGKVQEILPESALEGIVETEREYKLKFKIPVWADEGEYYTEKATTNEELLSSVIVVRVRAENDPNTSTTELGRYKSNFNNDYPEKNDKTNDDVLYNKESYDHRSFDYINTKVVGKLDGFELEYTDDAGFKYMMESTFSGLDAKELPYGQKGENTFNKNYNYGVKLGYKIKYTLITKGEKSSEVEIVPHAYFVTKKGPYISRVATPTVSGATTQPKRYEQGQLVPIDIYYQGDGNKYEKLTAASKTAVTTMMTKPGELPYIESSEIELTKKIHEAIANNRLSTKYGPKFNLAGANFNTIRQIGNVGKVVLNEYVRLRDNMSEEYSTNKEYGNKTAEQIIQDAGGEYIFSKAISKWYGEFYLPTTTRIIEKDVPLYNKSGKMQNINIQDDTDGYILVFFEIRTKDSLGKEYLSYQLPSKEEVNKWIQEGYMSEEGFITLPNINNTKIDKANVESVASSNDIGAVVAIYEAFITKDGNVVGRN